jgi:hypothetical protein
VIRNRVAHTTIINTDQVVATASGILDVQNRAAEVKLRAERQAGKLLRQLMLRGGDRRSKSHRERLKLDDLGLTPNQSKRWQLQARVPEGVFRDHVKYTCQEGKELTSAGLMRLAKRLTGESVGNNGHATGKKNGNTVDGHNLNNNEKSAAARVGKWDDRSHIGGLGENVGELKNHHNLLDESCVQFTAVIQYPCVRKNCGCCGI